jgi:hypothetical protein
MCLRMHLIWEPRAAIPAVTLDLRLSQAHKFPPTATLALSARPNHGGLAEQE